MKEKPHTQSLMQRTRSNSLSFAQEPYTRLVHPLWFDYLQITEQQVLSIFLESGRTRSESEIYRQLLKREIKVLDKCPRCNQKDSIEHLIFECPSSQKFIFKFQKLLSISLNIEMQSISIADIIFCFPNIRQAISSSKQKTYSLQVMHGCFLDSLITSRDYIAYPDSFMIDSFCNRLQARITFDYTRDQEILSPSIEEPESSSKRNRFSAFSMLSTSSTSSQNSVTLNPLAPRTCFLTEEALEISRRDNIWASDFVNVGNDGMARFLFWDRVV